MDIHYELGLIHNRLYHLERKENEFGYKDICMYMCVFYIVYVFCCELNLNNKI
jgi:hypothetical protein